MIGLYVTPAMYQYLQQRAEDEDRTMSNMTERILKTHPEIQAVLEAETAGVSA